MLVSIREFKFLVNFYMTRGPLVSHFSNIIFYFRPFLSLYVVNYVLELKILPKWHAV
jgi:hypothetical protein